MARYETYDLNQTKMIPLSYADQIVEGSFEHALCEIVEEHLDLGAFEKRYANDEAAAEDRALRLLQGHHFERDAGGGVPAKRGFHGAFGRRPAFRYERA